MKDCPLNGIRIDCGGRMTPDGLCFEHSILFDWWGCNGGYGLYDKKPREEVRKIFRDWVMGLTDKDLEMIKRGY